MDLNSQITVLSLSHNSTRFTSLMTINQFMAPMTAMAMFEEMP